MDPVVGSIVTAFIVGGLSLIGVIFTSVQNNRVIENRLATSQAVTDTKLQALTEEVKRHNDFWMRVPVLETRIETVEKDVVELQKQIDKIDNMVD